jgi:hypothetical protein
MQSVTKKQLLNINKYPLDIFPKVYHSKEYALTVKLIIECGKSGSLSRFSAYLGAIVLNIRSCFSYQSSNL